MINLHFGFEPAAQRILDDVEQRKRGNLAILGSIQCTEGYHVSRARVEFHVSHDKCGCTLQLSLSGSAFQSCRLGAVSIHPDRSRFICGRLLPPWPIRMGS